MDCKTKPFLSLSFLLLYLQSGTFTCFAGTINPGESLTGTRTLTSNGSGDFELGFFRPGASPDYYLGIWYRKVLKRMVVWVANRETPLPDLDSWEVRIGEDGNLVILHGYSEVPVWSSNSSLTNPNSAIVELLHSGNLVLRDRSNPAVVFWQSFDHPLLPGGRLQCSGTLVSWKSSDDPSPGPFSLRLDSYMMAQYSLVWNGERSYSTSGVWGGQITELSPESHSYSIYDYSFVATGEEDYTGREDYYFTYSVNDSSEITRLVMDLTGQLKQLVWLESEVEWDLLWSQPREECDVYSCGSFSICNEEGLSRCLCLGGFQPRSQKEWNSRDWSGGCERRTPLGCGKEDAFQLLSSVTSPPNGRPSPAKSKEECESDCRRSCSCSAFSFLVGCFIWETDLLNLQYLSDDDPRGVDIHLRLAASEVLIRSTGSDSSRVLLVRSTVGPLAGIASLLVAVYVVRSISGRIKRLHPLDLGPDTLLLLPFTFKDLQTITNKFSEKLGGGGFGSVFRGTLPDSSVVAVKKLEGLGQGEKQFRAEVRTIGTIQHRNLVRLRGFCSEGIHRLLVYDYMSQGSLASHLIVENSERVLDWETRYQIALGIARGLAYLHEQCRDCIIHCDIKPENVLLDASFCPKVADFGLAKLVGRELSRVLTTVRGTPGYLAPEWISGAAITPKADVYSYGMMLFEIVSGRTNLQQIGEGEFGFFPAWATERIILGENILSLLDSRLGGEADAVEVNRVCRVACWCIQDEEDKRPTMGRIVKILEGVERPEPSMPPDAVLPRSLEILGLNAEHSSTTTVHSLPISDQIKILSNGVN